MKLKPMSPHQARTLNEICSLKSDNYGGAEGWIMIDGPDVILKQQRSGEQPDGGVKFSRGAFKRMIDWYLREQQRSADNGS